MIIQNCEVTILMNIERRKQVMDHMDTTPVAEKNSWYQNKIAPHACHHITFDHLSDNVLADNFYFFFFSCMYAGKEKWIWPNNLKHNFFPKYIEHKLIDRDFNRTQKIKSHLRKKEGERSSKTNVDGLILWKKNWRNTKLSNSPSYNHTSKTNIY